MRRRPLDSATSPARLLAMLRLTLRIDFDQARSIGHGKIKLLETIDGHGSISAAARALEMSYRRAWLLVDATNKTFEEPVVAAKLGGKGGGTARLTPFGRALVETYRALERDALDRFGPRLAKFTKRIAKEAPKLER